MGPPDLGEVDVRSLARVSEKRRLGQSQVRRDCGLIDRFADLTLLTEMKRHRDQRSEMPANQRSRTWWVKRGVEGVLEAPQMASTSERWWRQFRLAQTLHNGLEDDSSPTQGILLRRG